MIYYKKDGTSQDFYLHDGQGKKTLRKREPHLPSKAVQINGEFRNLLQVYEKEISFHTPPDEYYWQFGTGYQCIIRNRKEIGLSQLMASKEGIPMSLQLLAFLESICSGRVNYCEKSIVRKFHVCDDERSMMNLDLLAPIQLITEKDQFERLCKLTKVLLRSTSKQCEFFLQSMYAWILHEQARE